MVDPLGLYEPAAHAVHTHDEVAPVRLLNAPAAQAPQAVGSLAASRSLKVPATHEVHDAGAARVLYVPQLQLVHPVVPLVKSL